MLDGIIFTVGLIMVIVSRYFYFMADNEDDVVRAIVVDAIGALAVIMPLLSYYESL